jgi:light-regulated signal transduction histidine kinase (bacteriophytochrome)
VLWNSANVYDNDGKQIIATIAQGQDITERIIAEEKVNNLNEILKRRASEAEVANKELEAFSYSVSHDLRAPLRSMEGFSQALLEDCSELLSDAGKDYLKRIQSSAELMAQLIDDMLRLSRITRADMTLDKVNLSEIAQSVSTKIKSSFPKRKIIFMITPGLTARADKNLLSIALENLFENAVKFTGKVPRAIIEFGITEKDGQKAYFVRDNGVGFDMTYANKLFKPFQRLHTVAEFPGNGIGLASVQRIIQRHGGQVWAEGKVGEGAAFYFTLEENKVI